MIRIPDWSDFQQYKDREPRWIKLHRTLLDNPCWGRLTGDEGKLLIELWLLAARVGSDGVIDRSIEEIAWTLRRSVESIRTALPALVEGGFVESVQICTDPPEGVYENVPREEKRREREETEAEADAREATAAAAAVENELELPPEAVAVLGDLTHLSSRRATERTIQARFLDPDDGSPMLDASVRGLPLAKRQELVASALLEYGDQAGEWKAQRFAAFVRKIRTRPKPGTEAALVEARGEPGGGRYVPATPYREDGPRELAKIDAKALLGAAGVRAPFTSTQEGHDG